MVTISVAEAIRQIKAGEVIALPTDTVYGLAAKYEEAGSVEKIFALKKRPETNPLPILAADYLQIIPFLTTAPTGFRQLAKEFWPGGLTVVLPVHQHMISEAVRAGLPSAAFRVPDHVVTHHLLKEVGPLAVTSANVSGQPPATDAEQVAEIFGEDFPVLHGGECAKKQPSTIVSYADGKWHLLREGAIPAAQLAEIIEFA